MGNISPVDQFIDKKKMDSPWIQLADGESIRIDKVKDIKMVTKIGYGGDGVEVLRLLCLVRGEDNELREKRSLIMIAANSQRSLRNVE